MDSRVVQSVAHENDEHYPHIVASEQVTQGAEEDQFDHEKKSVLNKVKAKAKKIKDTIKKHGHQVLDRGHEYNNEDQHTLDDHDLDEDDEMVEDPQVHKTPIHESEDVKTATPTSEQVENLGKSGIDSGGTTGTTVMGEEPRHDALLGSVSSTTEIDQNTATDSAKTSSVEEKAGQPKDNLEKSIGLDWEKEPHPPGSRPEAYPPTNYQTKITDPSVIEKDEIEKITPVEESFAKMNVHDVPKPTPEPNIQPTVVDSEYPPVGNHDQFVPHLSAATQTQYPSAESHDQFNQETTSTNINRNLENPTETGQTFNAGQPKDNLEKSIGLDWEKEPLPPGSRPEAYPPTNYQTKITDPSVIEKDEIEKITPVEESFAKMNVHDVPKLTPEPNIQPTVVDSDYPPVGNHDQFVPHLSAATQTQYPSAESHDQFNQETTSTNINRNLENPTETGQAFNAGQPKDNLEKSIGLDWEKEPQPPGSRPEAYPPTNYQTKITDPSVIEKDEIEKITPVEESFAKMNVHDVPKPTPEPNIQPTVVDSEYPPVGNHDQFVPNLSAATQTQYPSAESHDQFNQETTSTNINRNLENPTETGQTFNTITTTVEEKPLYEAKIDDVVSPKDVIASEAGSGEKDAIKDKVVTNEEQQKIGDASNMSGSTAQHGKNIAYSLTEKLAPVYDKVAGVGSAVKSKVTGTSTGGVVTETKNEVSVKDYLAEKLKPGEEDKALSEVISEALHKKKEEPVKNEDGNLDGGEESSVKSPGKGVVGKLKGVVGSWFGNAEEKGGEDLSKNTNSGAEVEQVHQVVGEIKSSPIEEQGTG